MDSLFKRNNLTALLAAVALFLASIEYIIPKPLPFMRLGLANLPLLIGLATLAPPAFLLLVLLKVMGQVLIMGTLFSHIFILSFCGSFASALVMLLIKKIAGHRISLIGLSIFGAMASNGLQLLIAALLFFGRQTWLLAPPFLLIGTISAAFLGFLAREYLCKSTWLAREISGDEQ